MLTNPNTGVIMRPEEPVLETEPVDVNPLELLPSEKKEVHKMLGELNSAKIALADAFLQTIELESRKNILIKNITESSKNLQSRVAGMAKSHGYEEVANKAPWSLDVESLTFSKP